MANALFLLPALRRARDLIDRDYGEPLDLDAVAAEAGYSRFHFARAFKAAYGETPRMYLTRRRIERAKALLRTANLSVTEICYFVGFASLGSFSARFLNLVGRSPSEYRDDAVARAGVPPIPGCVVRWCRSPRLPSSSARTPPLSDPGRRCHAPLVRSIYEAAGGGNGLLRLAHAWHERVVADEVVAHAFSHGFRPDHTRRVAAYWAEALGGPSAYSDRYGTETSVLRLHSGNGRHEEMDRRAIACFDQALEDAGLAADELVRQALHSYFAWATTTTMAQDPESADAVPAGLRIPRWSWDGLQVEQRRRPRHPAYG